MYVTVGSPFKKEIVMATYNIPDDHIFYSRDTSFAQGIKYITKGCGVDVVLNFLAGEELRATWQNVLLHMADSWRLGSEISSRTSNFP